MRNKVNDDVLSPTLALDSKLLAKSDVHVEVGWFLTNYRHSFDLYRMSWPARGINCWGWLGLVIEYRP